MKKRKATTTMTFAVTFKVPNGMTIPDIRNTIKRSLIEEGSLELKQDQDLKVHLTNKETSYA